jgi:hypothetical protein
LNKTNETEDGNTRQEDSNLIETSAFDASSLGAKIEGTISFVREDEIHLQQFGRDVTVSKPSVDVALRIKLIDSEIERLLHEKRRIMRQATFGKSFFKIESIPFFDAT